MRPCPASTASGQRLGHHVAFLEQELNIRQHLRLSLTNIT